MKIYEENPSEKQIDKVFDIFKSGGLVIIPTDSVYSIACDMNNRKAVENLAKLKGIKLKDADFSFIFGDLSCVSEYTKPISNSIFKIICNWFYVSKLKVIDPIFNRIFDSPVNELFQRRLTVCNGTSCLCKWN